MTSKRQSQGMCFWLRQRCPLALAAGVSLTSALAAPIDRHALVTRHSVTLTNWQPLSPLSVGNGTLAFTVDLTGLQTFPEVHREGTPLHTLSQWAWHSLPNPERYRLEDVMVTYDAGGRSVAYVGGPGETAQMRDPERGKQAVAWLRANPHRLDLGRLGFMLRHRDGSAAVPGDLSNTVQKLDLWTGCLESRFDFDGQSVRVLTGVHPDHDALAVSVESPLLARGQATLRLAFPFASSGWRDAADWNQPQRHQTRVTTRSNRCDLTRTLDADSYRVAVEWSSAGFLQTNGPHEFSLGTTSNRLECVVAFAPGPLGQALPGFAQTRAAAADHWRRFWESGGAVDFTGSKDPRAAELERRVVLSQFLTAIHASGAQPPQETGLVFNSWHGKFHLEMTWWHEAHFALWGRPELMAGSLGWFERALPNARATATRQGYAGARWPKMVGPEGRESPSDIGVYLIWQQPHPIYLAELIRRAQPTEATLRRYSNLVFATAEFMASYARLDSNTQQHVLGPPLIPAQESYGRDRRRVINPTFELAYWHWALNVAQQWRQQLGLPREPLWDDVIKGLPKPAVRDGLYTAIAVEPFTIREDHPSMLCALGMVPATPLVDPAIMSRTLDDVWKNWDWKSTWGWDYPVMAMTAARLNRPEQAVEALLVTQQKNRYLPNGHNYQDARLPLYLPGNGGLLYAVAMMAGGWDGAPNRPAPGFPHNGRWQVRAEGLQRAP